MYQLVDAVVAYLLNPCTGFVGLDRGVISTSVKVRGCLNLIQYVNKHGRLIQQAHA
jgi:hypothetical protein